MQLNAGWLTRRFDSAQAHGHLSVTRGQLAFEWYRLMEKLRARDPRRQALMEKVNRPQPHPRFRVFPGDVADWEKGA